MNKKILLPYVMVAVLALSGCAKATETEKSNDLVPVGVSKDVIFL